jgi:ABC-type branched-subunit amino acid transport system substrate-binding protein
MLIPLTWHRSVLDECTTEEDELELECKAAKIFPNQEEQEINKPLAINWRTATAYESTKAILEGLKIAKEEPKYCGGLFKSFKVHNCMRQELKNVLLSNEFQKLSIKGAKASTSINFEGGERLFSEDLGVVVEAKNKNFRKYSID